MRAAQQLDLGGHLSDVSMQDFAFPAVLAQIAQDFHRRGQGVGFAAGQDIAAFFFQTAEYLQEISLAAAGSHVQQGKIRCKVLIERHPDERFAQRCGQRADVAVHVFLGHLGQWAADLIKADHLSIPPVPD